MTVAETNQEWQVLQLRVHTFAACAVVSLQQLPEKLNPIIKPLMETIKKEENTLVQNYAAQYIAKLLQQCTTRTPCPNSKVIKNLCSSLCVDPYLTPCVTCPVPTQSGQENSKGICLNLCLHREGIDHLSLVSLDYRYNLSTNLDLFKATLPISYSDERKLDDNEVVSVRVFARQSSSVQTNLRRRREIVG